MKKLLVVSALSLAGLMSANIKNEVPKEKKETQKNEVKKQKENVERECRVYHSSCGEAGFFCRDAAEFPEEEYIEFGYLVEDTFCGGCYIDC